MRQFSKLVRGFLHIAFLAILCCVSAFAVAAPDGIRARVGYLSAESAWRLSFDWKTEVPFSVTQTGDTVNIKFQQTEKIDLKKFRSQLPKSLTFLNSKADKKGLEINLKIDKDAQVTSKREGKTVHIDIAPPKPAPAVGATADPADANKKPENTEVHAAPQSDQDKEGAAKTDTTKSEELSKPQESPFTAIKELSESLDAAGKKSLSVKTIQENEGLRLDFLWPFRTDAAVFTFREDLWIFFKSKIKVDLSEFRTVPRDIVRAVEEVNVEGATALRLEIDTRLYAEVSKKEEIWRISLKPQFVKLTHPIDPSVTTMRNNTIGYKFPAKGHGVITFSPKRRAVTVQIAPLEQEGAGVSETITSSDAMILASATGVAVIRYRDDVNLISDEQGIELSHPEGLLLSSDTERNLQPMRTFVPYLYDFDRWERKGVTIEELESLLNNEIAKAKTEDKNLMRMDLARTYLARGLGAEAVSMLGIMKDTDAQIRNDVSYQSLLGAASYITRDYDVARGMFSTPQLFHDREAGFWRGIMAASKETSRNAYDLIRGGLPYLAHYPLFLKVDFIPVAVNVALEAEDFKLAESFFKLLQNPEKNIANESLTPDQQNVMNYWRGKYLAATKREHEAVQIWQDLQSKSDEHVKALAAFSLVDLREKNKEISHPDAIRMLQKIALSWRGDQLEHKSLERLGDLFEEDKNYFDALSSYRKAVQYFPGNIRNVRIRDKMRALFAKVFDKENIHSITAFDALSLYKEFGKLAPKGDIGNQQLLNVVEKLMDLDLIEEATPVLQELITKRLSGVERDNAVLRLAEIYLHVNDPEKAQAVIDKYQPAHSNKFAHVQSLIHVAVGDENDAIGLLAKNLSSIDSLILLANTYWNKEDWPNAVHTYEKLIALEVKEKKTPNPQHVLNWVTALAYTGDTNQIAVVSKKYKKLMNKSPYKSQFNLIVAPATPLPKDVRTLQKYLNQSEKVLDITEK